MSWSWAEFAFFFVVLYGVGYALAFGVRAVREWLERRGAGESDNN